MRNFFMMTSKLEIDRVRIAVGVFTVNVGPDLRVPTGRNRDRTGYAGRAPTSG
jgi:hypothetical protein